MQQLQKYFTLRNVIIFGLLISIGVTLSEVLRDKQFNYYIFRLATLDFWNGIMPYGENWFRHGYDYYLYPPTFNVLFLPFALIPQPIAEFVWNLFNYGIWVYAIYSFPNIDKHSKACILMFLLPILAAAQLSFQYNVGVAALFILAFSLLERGRYVWAVLLIMVSAVTKVYGLAELAILVFYPKLWRNVMLAIVFGVLLIALPLIKLNWAEFVSYYQNLALSLSTHKASRSWQTIFDMKIMNLGEMRYIVMPYIQVGIFAVMSVIVLFKRKLWQNFTFRIGVVAAIMGWCILFGNSSETHTYLIALTGYLLWYWSIPVRTKWLKICYWAMLIVLVLIPVDLICPPVVMRYVFNTMDLNQWIFIVAWATMLCHIFTEKITGSTNLKFQKKLLPLQKV